MDGFDNKEKTLTVLSWNVNGFNRKKSSVLMHLNCLKAHVVFLQETHVGSSRNFSEGSIQIQELDHDYTWAVFTVFKANCRGVAVIFKRDLGCEGFRVIGDKKGRFMIISCKIWGKDFVFVNVYNPKDEKIDFTEFSDLLIQTPKSSYFVAGGDFNTVLETEFDKTSNIRNRGHKDRLKGLLGFLETFELVDVWRCLYPEEKSFTYFDGKGRSRLDYFFVPGKTLRKVTACKIHVRPQYAEKEDYISDHAPISVQIQTGDCRWQFDQSLFGDEESIAHLSCTIQNYSGQGMKRKGDLWPGLKVRLACEAAACKRKRDEKAEEKEERTAEEKEERTEEEKEERTAEGKEERTEEEKEERTEEEKEERTAEEKEERTEDESEGLQLPHGSFDATCLNALQVPISQYESGLQDYLDKLYKTKRSEELQSTLNAILTEQIAKKEILSAILSLSDSHCHTPDGLPVQVYQHFTCQLIDYLQAFFNQVLILRPVKCAFNESITHNLSVPIVPQTGKHDHNYADTVQFYSPTSSINVDYNILASILAERLNSVMEHILNPGQSRTGLSVQSCTNTLEKVKASQLPILVISLKVDPGSLKWPYLFYRLKTLKLPVRFRAVLKSLVMTGFSDDGLHSSLSRGLKVGCPLTPALVRLCLLPFIHSIIHEERLLGVEVREGETMKALIDTERAIVFLSHPNNALEIFEKLLTDFTTNSGLIVDDRYAEVFSVGFRLCPEKLKQFNRTTNGFWYHGSFVGSECHDKAS